ncbi:MAG TPA: fasciclin domain-containing protein [Oculatellaceae cyanobacterium]
MKRIKSFPGIILFGLLSLSSAVVLSACSTPNTTADNNTSQQPTAQSPEAASSPADQTAATTTSPNTVASENPNATASGNIVELASTNASFKTLTKAVQAAGLTETLSGKGPYTVFAPTDEAFAALPQGTVEDLLKPENKDKLVKLLTYHVIPSEVTSSQITPGEVKTVEGTPVKIQVDKSSSEVKVNNAKVTQPDIKATNGVIHVVDKVIMPPKS